MPYADPSNHELPFQSGSETSYEAAKRANDFVGEQGAEVLHWLQDQGLHGATQKEVAAALDLGRPSVCARVHALEKRGDLQKTEGRRDGCAVYVAIRRRS